jgi:uncharacterized protein YjiS (DUF1127 family)
MAGCVPSIPLSSASVPARRIRARDIPTLLGLMLQVRRERRALQALDDFALKDLGLTRGDVYREAARRPWDLPRRRR